MSYDLKFKNNYILNIAYGVLIGALTTLVTLFVFSVIYTYVDIPEYFNAVFATVALILGAFLGGSFTVSKINEKGYLYGALVGVILFIFVFLISVVVSGNSISLTSLFHFLCTVTSEWIAGIIRANKESNKKYLR